MLKNEKKSVIGRGFEDRVLKSMPSNINKYTILSRTVRGVITQALIAATERKNYTGLAVLMPTNYLSLKTCFGFLNNNTIKLETK